jgi:DNA-binding NtrC family response regulator
MTAPSIQRQSGGREESGLEFSAIVAESAGMRHALHMAKRVATTPLRALLLNGEAGTGKELVARCIHNAGLNANAPFVSINCASIPAPLLDVELFGTPLTRNEPNRKLGVLELTGRGTVFLDEVGEMPLALQDRLLRTLEEYSISRFGLGGTEGTVHCRVIAASKTRLEERVAAGAFREDLLARLSVLRIELPPLREREDDVHLIAEHLLAEAARLQGTPRRQLGLDAASVLRAHRWPGNVRELKHVIERAMVVCEGPLIGAEHLAINQRRAGAAVRGATTFGEIRIPSEGKRLRDIEREALELTLQLTDYNQSAAARILCISRPTLARKLRAYGLKAERGE